MEKKTRYWNLVISLFLSAAFVTYFTTTSCASAPKPVPHVTLREWCEAECPDQGTAGGTIPYPDGSSLHVCACEGKRDREKSKTLITPNGPIKI